MTEVSKSEAPALARPGFRPGLVAYWAQRISGLVLLVLVPLKIITGYGLVGRWPQPTWLTTTFHLGAVINALLMAAVLVHALFGLRVTLLEWGLSFNGDRLFTIMAVLTVVLFGVGFYFLVV